jgi:hypothetical protein
MGNEAMRFCDITTVGELIKALEHFDEETPVEIVFETYAHRCIASVGARIIDEDNTIIEIIPHDP